MDIKTLFTWKYVRFVLITVLLGAVGSGVWEWMLKPVISGSSEVVLNVATLGVTAFKNSLYQDIALGFREGPSLRLYFAVFGFLPTFIVAFMAGFLTSHRRVKIRRSESGLDRAMDWSFKPILMIVIFLLIFSIVQASQTAYINRAITYFQQLSAIAAPYLSDEQRLLIRSRFAQISTREDYAKLEDELAKVCRARNQRLPDFKVW